MFFLGPDRAENAGQVEKAWARLTTAEKERDAAELELHRQLELSACTQLADGRCSALRDSEVSLSIEFVSLSFKLLA